MWFGVQIIAASGRDGEERRAEMEAWCGVRREAASSGLWGAGSVREWRVVLGFVRMERVWRGPMRPAPTIAMESFGEVDGVEEVI